MKKNPFKKRLRTHEDEKDDNNDGRNQMHPDIDEDEEDGLVDYKKPNTQPSAQEKSDTKPSPEVSRPVEKKPSQPANPNPVRQKSQERSMNNGSTFRLPI